MGKEGKGMDVSRRGFMRTSALAGMAAAIPAAGLASGERAISASRPSPAGKKRTLLFLSDNPESSSGLMESFKAIKEYEIDVIPIKENFKNPEGILRVIREKNADILFMSLPGVAGMSKRFIAEGMGTLDVPVILFPTNLDLMMWETDLVASFRIKGTNSLLANSERHAIELIKILAAPRILEGKKALVFGKPFNSTSIPSPNLNEDYVYKQTGVRIEHRPIEELRELLKGVDETAARREMERWKKEAVKISGPTDEMILNSSKMSVLLRSIVEKEGLTGISVDCLSYSFTPDATMPLPCLAFTRLRDEGISGTCEADICMMLSSMVMQELIHRPSFQCNVSSVNRETSSAVLRHCVAPTKIYGADAPALPFNLWDYHGMGKGAVPDLEYPVGLDITVGGFSKDLKDFVLWPGRVIPGIDDRKTPSFKDAPPQMSKMRKYCSVRAEVKIKEIQRFIQSIVGIHHIMVAGSYSKEIYDAMMRMNVNVIAPPDLTPPEV